MPQELVAPALLGVIGSAAIFRTVVDSAIKAAAGGTAAEIGKTAGAGLVKGAIAGMAGMALSKLADGFMDSVEVSGDENLASFQADADLPTGDIADSLPDMSPEEVDEFLANLQSEPGAVGDMFADSMDRQIDSILDQANVGPEYAAKLEEILKANTVAGPDGISSSFNGGSSMGVLFNAEEYAEYQSIIANNGGGMDGLFSEAAKEFRAEISAEAGIGVADVAGEFAGDVGDADLATTDFDAPDVSGDVADATAGAGDVAGATGDAVGSTFSQYGIPTDKVADLAKQLSDNGLSLNVVADTDAGNELRSQIAKQIRDLAKEVADGNVGIESDVRSAIEQGIKYPQILNQSFVHPEWKNVLSEEIGKDFDDLVEQVGEQVAVFAMLEWYNSWVKENTIAIEGLNHLQEHRLIENIEQSIKEAPGGGLSNIAKKVGSAYNKATAAVGKGAQAVVGGAMNVLIKPVLNSVPVKGFLNKVQQAVGMQGAIDPTKLQADYEGAGSPTDSDEVGKFLIKNAGATKSEVDAAFKGAGVEAQAPEETPDDEPTSQKVEISQKDRGGETSQKVV